MKIYSKMSVLFNCLTVGLLLSLGMVAEYAMNLSHEFIKKKYPAVELTLKNIYQKYTNPQQLAI